MQAQQLTIEEYEKIQPIVQLEVGDRVIAYNIPNSQTMWRVQTLAQKEPDTLAWIDSFKAGEVLIDIGANVGMYTIWAAKLRDVKVYAFEPESQNYALLNKNIFINQLADKVQAYAVALSDEEGFSPLYLSEFLGGGSCHTFGESVNFKLEQFKSKFQQGCYATTLDKLVATGAIPAPDHIKIDVDGIEHKVIKGCEILLKDPKLQSLLVELNTNLELHRDLVEHIKGMGFGVSQDQLNIAMRTEGAFKGVGNHIFRRDLA